jgi:hypothetical protein
MNKKLKIGGLIAIVLVAASFFTVQAVVSKPVTEEEKLEDFLYTAGFKTAPSMNENNLTSFWKTRYGLRFFTDEYMKILCDTNKFIIAPATRFKDGVPHESAKIMMENYKKIEDDLVYYEFESRWSTGVLGRFSRNELKESIDEEAAVSGASSGFFSHYPSDLGGIVKKRVLQQWSIPPGSQWEMKKNPQYRDIYVVADPRKFDTKGLEISGHIADNPKPPKKDPIAVVRHRGGWVVLAAWE